MMPKRLVKVMRSETRGTRVRSEVNTKTIRLEKVVARGYRYEELAEVETFRFSRNKQGSAHGFREFLVVGATCGKS